jgi:hypothetical protein
VVVLGLAALWGSFGRGALNSPSASERSNAATGLGYRLAGPAPAGGVFQLKLRTEGKTQGKALYATGLDASLEVLALAEQDHGTRFGARLATPKLSQLGTVTPDEQRMLAGLERQLERPFEFFVAANGAVGAVRLPGGTDVLVSRLVRSVLAYTQVLTDPESKSEWEVIELEPSGSARVRYELVAGASRLQKKKIELIGTRDPGVVGGFNAHDVTLVGASASVSFDAAKIVTAIDYEERLSATLPDVLGAGKLDVVTNFSLSRRRDAGAAELASLVTKPRSLGKPRPLQEEATPPGRSYSADVQRIGGRDVKGIAAELLALSTRKDTKVGSDRSRLYIAATALFRREPSAVTEALEAIRTNAANREFLIGALGHAGSAEAADALTGLLEQARDAAYARTVLGALGNASQASVETVETMSARFDDRQVGGYARLMVGALARSSRDDAPAASDAAVDRLLAALETETNMLIIADTLRALGNSGHPKAVEAAERYVGNSSAILRAAAAQAVRLIASAEADGILSRLLPDAQVSVRVSALNACLDRVGGALLGPLVESLAKLDDDPNVRREAIRVLVAWRDSLPTARAALVWVSQNDANEKLRAIAVEGLNRFKREG